jgi:excisionase family DNA binding protein
MAVERRTYNIPEVAEILGISRVSAYDLAHSKGFPAIFVGERRIVVPREAFERWMLEAAGQSSSEGEVS